MIQTSPQWTDDVGALRIAQALALDAPAQVRLSVYDALGREVAVLADGTMAAGPHAARFEGAALPTGVYLARLTAETASGTRVVLSQRLTLLR